MAVSDGVSFVLAMMIKDRVKSFERQSVLLNLNISVGDNVPVKIFQNNSVDALWIFLELSNRQRVQRNGVQPCH